MINVRLRMPVTMRESMACGVIFELAARHRFRQAGRFPLDNQAGSFRVTSAARSRYRRCQDHVQLSPIGPGGEQVTDG